jgi:hypothetical protein
MAKKKTAKRMGRPITTGKRPFTGARLSKEVLDAIDHYAKANKIGRSEAIRKLMDIALATLK